MSQSHPVKHYLSLLFSYKEQESTLIYSTQSGQESPVLVYHVTVATPSKATSVRPEISDLVTRIYWHRWRCPGLITASNFELPYAQKEMEDLFSGVGSEVVAHLLSLDWIHYRSGEEYYADPYNALPQAPEGVGGEEMCDEGECDEIDASEFLQEG